MKNFFGQSVGATMMTYMTDRLPYKNNSLLEEIMSIDIRCRMDCPNV